MKTPVSVHDSRAEYSRMRLDELKRQLTGVRELEAFPGLTIFGAGSYARLEASKYSDLDLFFLSEERKVDVVEPRTHSLRLFGRVISIADTMGFPKFSNDCEYLSILHADDMLANLGSRTDDHENYFTVRMLFLLESHCLFGEGAFDQIQQKVVNSYFKDFPDHEYTFQPLFLINDICRFWKTLLLNYENKRQIPPGSGDAEARRTRQKVRNFKLKYSRMTTCFASVAALGSFAAPVTQDQVIEITRLTPRQRLESVVDRVPQAAEAVAAVLAGYSAFLDMTGMSTDDLEAQFADKQRRSELFGNANAYGDTMFKLIQVIDGADERRKLLRLLVI